MARERGAQATPDPNPNPNPNPNPSTNPTPNPSPTEALKGAARPPLEPRGRALSATNRSVGAIVEARLQLP